MMGQETIKTIDDLIRIVEKPGKLYLYGAGAVSRKIIKVLEIIKRRDYVYAILVTNIKNQQTIDGIQIINYDKNKIKNDDKVLIATTAYMQEIYSALSRDNVNNLILVDEKFEEVLDVFIDKQEKQRICTVRDRLVWNFRKEQVETHYDIAFITPPYWDMYSPFSAVPCLKARLKQEGYEVYQIDIGIICTHYAIKRYGKEVIKKLLSPQCYEDLICCYEENPYTTYEQYINDMDFFYSQNFNVNEIKTRYKTMNFVQRCVVDNFYYGINSMDSSTIDFDNCTSIIDAVNMYSLKFMWEIFEEKSVKRLFSSLPDIIGISITSPCQFLPGCLLAKFIHQIKPETKIIFGGSCADLFINSEYIHKYDIYQYFDYILVGEGESAITQTIRSIHGEADISEIPNLAVIDTDNEVKLNNVIVEDVLKLPLPDYDDLDLGLYLSPELILPYQSSRGCHYGYCAFCNHDEKYRHNYRTKHMKKVVEDLVSLSKRYNCKYFQFVDEAIRPDCFRLMVEEMERNLEFADIKWFYYSRVSREYDQVILEKAYNNGCQMVMLGVESFNQRLLNFIKKGINAETSKYCLRLFKQCKIKTYVWLMDNLPSETIDEAKGDLEEVKRLREYIDAFSVGPFMLVKNTDMYKNLESYNIIEKNDLDPVRFQSHNNGQVIDKEEMLQFDAHEYQKYQLRTFLFGNRYTLFFDL